MAKNNLPTLVKIQENRVGRWMTVAMVPLDEVNRWLDKFGRGKADYRVACQGPQYELTGTVVVRNNIEVMRLLVKPEPWRKSHSSTIWWNDGGEYKQVEVI